MKTKKLFKQTGKYLRELSIVVIGVAITVSIGLWINNINNRKDLKQYLTAVKMELESNARNFDFYAEWYQKSVRYANYISRTDKKTIDKDTLNYYKITDNDGCGYGYYHSSAFVKTNVFEMFKTSGIMRQMNDKMLLETIWEVYSMQLNTQLFLDLCFQTKREEVIKETQLRAEGKPIAVPMQTFYSTDLPYAMVRVCKETSEILKETASKLEKAL